MSKVQTTNNSTIDSEKNDDKIQNKKKKSIPKKIRQLVWNKWIGEEKGNGSCRCCEITKISQMDFVCGHIISEFNGGDITLDNLMPICHLCNSSMGTTNLNEFKKAHRLEKKENETIKKAHNSIESKTRYFCSPCKYYTCKTSNFKRHMECKTHEKISDDIITNDTDLNNYKKTIYCCNNCDVFYTTKRSLEKHELMCFTTHTTQILKDKIDELQKELSEKTDQIKTKRK